MIKRKYTVLLADDDESVCDSLRKLLLGEGYEVVSATNGTEAVDAFNHQQDEIDLLLVDLNMPVKNGWAELDRLLEVNPSLPAIIITGQPNQCELAETAKVSALVEKPIDVQALLELMHSLLAEPFGSGPQRSRRPELPFHLVRAAGCKSRYTWIEQHVTPHPRGGLNE